MPCVKDSQFDTVSMHYLLNMIGGNSKKLFFCDTILFRETYNIFLCEIIMF